MDDNSRILNKVFDTLDRLFLDNYVITNKYDEMPDSIPSDIDINVSLRDFSRLDFVITALSKEMGLAITQKIQNNYRCCAYILSPYVLYRPFRLQLDFFSDFCLNNIPLLIPCHEMNNNTRKYGRFNVPAYHVEYVFLLFRRIFKNDFSIEHLHILNTALFQDKSKTIKYSSIYFGDKLANQIAEKVEKEDIKGLSRIRESLLKQMKRYSFKEALGVYYLRFWFNQLKRKFIRIKYPVGMSIAFLGPDGCGKSTIIEKIDYLCWGSFHGIEKKYFRPRLLKNIGQLNRFNPTFEAESNTNPHGVSLDSFFKSLLRYTYYNVDFIFGFWLKIRPIEIKKKLVVFDRYYFDYYVDMKRYKYNLPKWFPRLFEVLIPRPDLIFILDGNAEVFFRRKQELPIKELTRQIVEYREISYSVKNSILVNTIRPVDEIAMNITKDILLFKAKRTAHTMGNMLGEDGIPL